MELVIRMSSYEPIVGIVEPNGIIGQVESTVFSSNTDPGTNGTSGAAAEFNAANDTEVNFLILVSG